MNHIQISSQGPRAENQDCAAVEELSDGSLLCCVADGVGGHNGGKVASNEAIHIFINLVKQNVYSLEDCALKTHEAISKMSVSDPSLFGMATTLSAVLISENRITGIHCGDSRVYLLRANGIKQLTDDQTEVARLIKIGKLTKEDAIDYPRKNVLYSAIGGNKTPELQVLNFDIKSGDRLILTTDGAHNFLPKRFLRDASIASNSIGLLITKLEQQLLASELNDNYTIVAVQA